MKIEKKNVLKWIDVVVILIAFFVTIYSRDTLIGIVSLGILYIALRNIIKEFVYPY